MIENVAVVHRLAGVVAECHSDSDASASGDEHNVTPGTVRRAVRSNHLEGVCMEVERMVHGRRIDQVPVFDGTE